MLQDSFRRSLGLGQLVALTQRSHCRRFGGGKLWTDSVAAAKAAGGFGGRPNPSWHVSYPAGDTLTKHDRCGAVRLYPHPISIFCERGPPFDRNPLFRVSFCSDHFILCDPFQPPPAAPFPAAPDRALEPCTSLSRSPITLRLLPPSRVQLLESPRNNRA